MSILTRETQLDKAKRMLGDVVAYTEEIVRDEQLRADLRSAADHGSKAGERVKKAMDGGLPSRLAEDTKLRRNLRKMLDDLDSASDRVRRKKQHRMRNALLAMGAAVGGIAAFFLARDRLSGSSSTGYDETRST